MSNAEPRSSQVKAEARIQALCVAGDAPGATHLALRTYGPEVLGFLCIVIGQPAEADEVFSLFCEDLWKGLPRFEWRSSLRTWVYVLARNAYLRHKIRATRRQAHQPEPLDSEVMNQAAEVRQSTLSHLRMARLEQVRQLRNTLAPDEQMLLTLRLDRQMEWPEIVQVLEPGTEDPQRMASTLRKRFQRLKERLRAQVAPLKQADTS